MSVVSDRLVSSVVRRVFFDLVFTIDHAHVFVLAALAVLAALFLLLRCSASIQHHCSVGGTHRQSGKMHFGIALRHRGFSHFVVGGRFIFVLFVLPERCCSAEAIWLWRR